MRDKIKLLVSNLGETRVKENVDLTEHLQTRLGGPAAAFYIATTLRELTRSIQLCRELRIPFLLIGSGSKMAISDQGVRGLAIKNRSDSIKIFGVKGKVSRTGIGIEEAFLEADSGVSLVKLADFSASQGLGGLEVLRTTAGTVGGSFYITPVLKEKSFEVKVLTNSGGVKGKSADAVKKEDIILSVVFKLKAKKI